MRLLRVAQGRGTNSALCLVAKRNPVMISNGVEGTCLFGDETQCFTRNRWTRLGCECPRTFLDISSTTPNVDLIPQALIFLTYLRTEPLMSTAPGWPTYEYFVEDSDTAKHVLIRLNCPDR